MPQGPECSVVIPARNAAPWLGGSIASIGAKAAVEILVVDDGSTDGTGELLGGLAAADARIVPLTGPRRGAAAARNAALAVAAAPLVAFLDADDRWRPGKLAAQLALHAARPELGFSFTDYRHVTEAGEDRGTCFGYWPGFRTRHGAWLEAFLLGPDALAQLFAENVVGTSTVMVRTALLRETGGFDESLRQAEDWDLWLRLAARAPVGCVPLVGTDYLMHRPGNLSQDTAARAAALRLVAARHRAAAAGLDPGAARRCAARLLVAEAEAAAAAGQGWRAAGKQVQALLQAPDRRAARSAAAAVLRAATGRGLRPA
ncbi:glycosyltransferase family 2 protein [Dankookia sp. GCM10030260]|uniref:glycosyltransferase family 2 protein n=1 Tax=Dankookia sp. GCM10030260 TaxID=3273390 RepID=UPI0036116988